MANIPKDTKLYESIKNKIETHTPKQSTEKTQQPQKGIHGNYTKQNNMH